MALRPFGVRVAAVARITGAPHNLVLRDYALGYLLVAIYSDADLGGAIVFKGGTALRKCFFRGYRFSEDLGLHPAREEDRFEVALGAAAETAIQLTAPYRVFRFVVERKQHRQQHLFGQLDFRLRVDYPTGASLPIKVEITRDEPMILPSVRLDLIHLFDGEDLASKLQVLFARGDRHRESFAPSYRHGRTLTSGIGSTVPATSMTSATSGGRTRCAWTGSRFAARWRRRHVASNFPVRLTFVPNALSRPTGSSGSLASVTLYRTSQPLMKPSASSTRYWLQSLVDP